MGKLRDISTIRNCQLLLLSLRYSPQFPLPKTLNIPTFIIYLYFSILHCTAVQPLQPSGLDEAIYKIFWHFVNLRTRVQKCTKCEKSITKNIVKPDKTVSIHFLFFAFRECFLAFCDKCIASLRTELLLEQQHVSAPSPW